MILTADELDTIRRHAVEEYPREACGVVMVRGGERRLLRCRNAQDELHARDPEQFPRDGRTAYHIAADDRLRMVRLESEGFAMSVIYHSHVDAGAYFSATDKRQALVDDQPMYPEATYVVASVVEGRVAAIGAFRWDPAARDFVDLEADLDAGGEA